MIKTLTIMLIIAGLIIFFLILAMIGQLNDLGEYEKRINKAIKYIFEIQDSNPTLDLSGDEAGEIVDILRGEE